MFDPCPCGIHRHDCKYHRTGKYGVFSARAASNCGTVIYAAPDGAEVEVTVVVDASNLDDLSTWYLWKDAIVVGPVTSYVRQDPRRA